MSRPAEILAERETRRSDMAPIGTHYRPHRTAPHWTVEQYRALRPPVSRDAEHIQAALTGWWPKPAAWGGIVVRVCAMGLVGVVLVAALKELA